MPPVVRTRDGLVPLKARRRAVWLRTEFVVFAWIIALIAVVPFTLFLR